jgi:hypothetical protein
VSPLAHGRQTPDQSCRSPLAKVGGAFLRPPSRTPRVYFISFVIQPRSVSGHILVLVRYLDSLMVMGRRGNEKSRQATVSHEDFQPASNDDAKEESCRKRDDQHEGYSPIRSSARFSPAIA